MSNRRMALAGVVAALIGVAVWWLSGALRSSSKATPATGGGDAVATHGPESDEHGLWHTPRRQDTTDKADPRGDIRLEGQVIDQQQQPVGGATVVIDANPPLIVVSEADGSFAFEGLLARSYWVNAYKEGARADAKRIRARADTEPVILRMYEGMTVVITVIDRDSRAPIADAAVTTGQLLEQTAITDAAGKAELKGLPPSYGFASVEAEGYAPGRIRFQIPDDPGGRFDRSVELGRGASVSGIVLDPTGKGLGGTTVYGTSEDGGVHADTAADGTWTVPAVSAGQWVFTCPGEQWAPGTSDPVKVDGKTPIDGVEIHLKAGARIAGIVVDARGAPVPRASVTASPEGDSPANAISNEDGTFEILGLPRNKYVVVAFEGDRGSEQLPADVRTTDVGDLRVTIAEATIGGVVVDAAGEPVAEAEVVARPDAMTMYYFPEDTRTVTDSSGRWTVGPVSAETYEITARWPDSGPSNPSRRSYGDDGTKAKRGDHDVRIVLHAAATVRGVVTSGGAPVTRFAISVSQRRPERETPQIVSSTDGKFERSGLTPGTYSITIGGADFATRTITKVVLEAGKTNDLGTIEVEAGRTIRGRVVDATGAPVADAVIAASRFGRARDEDPLQAALRGSRQTRSGEDGSFELRAIATDARGLVLVADKDGVGRSKRLPLPDGDAEVTLTLLVTGSIVVTVEGGSDRVSVSAELVGGGASESSYGDPGGISRLGGLIPGTYEVVAESMPGMRKSSRATVEVKGGESVQVTVRFPTGGVTVVIEPGDECQMVMLMRGHGEAFDMDATVSMAMCQPNTPVEIEHIEPGDYRVCLATDCTPITVKPSPDRQTFKVP